MSDKSALRAIVEALAGTDQPTFEQIDEFYPMAERIFEALIDAGHLPRPACGDCAVQPGQPHVPGCDVARCKLCGWQDIGDHTCPEPRPSTIWTGRYPGKVEVDEYGLTGLNELAARCAAGEFRWDGDKERWFRA